MISQLKKKTDTPSASEDEPKPSCWDRVKVRIVLEILSAIMKKLALLKDFVILLSGEIPSFPRSVPQGLCLDSIEEASALWQWRNWRSVHPSPSSLALA